MAEGLAHPSFRVDHDSFHCFRLAGEGESWRNGNDGRHGFDFYERVVTAIRNQLWKLEEDLLFRFLGIPLPSQVSQRAFVLPAQRSVVRILREAHECG